MAGQSVRRRMVATVAATITLVGLGAGAGGASAAGSASPAAPAAARKAAPGAGSNAVTITAHDSSSRMSYSVTGKPRQGRVAIHLVNKGHYTHEATLLRLKPGATLAQFKQALQGPDSETAAGALIVNPDGEITGPALLGPGRQETVFAPLHAGRYVVICFLPGPDGMPHAMMGMVAGMTVRSARSHATPPADDGTVRLSNKGISLPRGFAHGGTFKVVNTSKRAHDFSVARLGKGTSLGQLFQCVGQSFGAGTMVDACPGRLAGGVTDLAPGRTAYLRIHFGTGHYGYLSTDGNDFANGLRGTFTVR